MMIINLFISHLQGREYKFLIYNDNKLKYIYLLLVLDLTLLII